MIKDIDHIAIKVDNIDRVTKSLEKIGIKCRSIEEFKEVGMKIAFLGDEKKNLELLEVANSNSPISNDPLGLHHMGFKVNDLEATYEMMKADDMYKVEGTIRRGAHSRIFFFRLCSQDNILFECVE